MATMSPSKDYHMDTLENDDTMQMATSPNPLEDDLDLDLDLMQDPDVEHNMLDDTDFKAGDVDTMEPETNIAYDDEYMFDDPAIDQATMEDVPELSMDAYEHNTDPDQDEEILYDEEETVSAVKVDEMEDMGEDLHVDIATEDNTGEFTKQDLDYQTQLDHTKIDIQHTNHDNNDLVVTEPDTSTDKTDKAAPPPTSPHFYNNDDLLNEDESSMAGNSKPNVQEQKTTETNDYGEDLSPTATRTLDESGNLHTKEAADDYAESDTNITAQNRQDKGLDVEPHLMPSEAEAEVDHDGNKATLHPITVMYLGQEMSLFPPLNTDSSSTFFVTDANLAYEPIDKLLSACRSVLGDSLEHDDELVLDIPTLGLHICEDSKYASELNLEQIVEVYLALSRNGDMAETGPLLCNLSSRVCLSSQFAYLNNAARDGKSYSEIVAEHIDSPDAEAQDYEDEFTEDQGQGQGIDSTLNETNDTLEDDEEREDQITGFAHPESSALPVDEDNSFDPEQILDIETQSELAQPQASNKALFSEDKLDEQDLHEHLESADDINENLTQDHYDMGKGQEELPASHSHERSFLDDVQTTTDSSVPLQPKPSAGHDETHVHSSTNETTPSSHTVEADQDDYAETTAVQSRIANDLEESGQTSFALENHTLDPNAEAEDEDREVEDEEGEDFDLPEDELGLGQDTVYEADVLEHVDTLLEEGEEEQPEDLFAPELDEDVDATAEDAVKHLGSDTDEPDEAQATNPLNTLSTTDTTKTSNLHVEQSEILQPTTPSKQASGKRKASENEDELDLFEFDTPEPKRRRPS